MGIRKHTVEVKKRTIGYIPLIEDHPGIFCEWTEDGKRVGQICFAHTHIKLSRSRGTVRHQIARTLDFRTKFGYARDGEDLRFRIQRVIG